MECSFVVICLLRLVNGFLIHSNTKIRPPPAVVRRAEPDKDKLTYAADFRLPNQGPLTERSFMAQFELEEREDKEVSRTLIELRDAGYAYIGATDGVPFNAASGRWLYLPKEKILILEILRNYEDYNTIRLLIADVIALDKTPAVIEGAIKIPKQSAPDLMSAFRTYYEEDSNYIGSDAVGFFTAMKVPEPVPLAVDES